MPSLTEWREDILATAFQYTLDPDGQPPVHTFPEGENVDGLPAVVLYQGYDGQFIAPNSEDSDYCRLEARWSAGLFAGPSLDPESADLLDRWVMRLPAVMKDARSSDGVAGSRDSGPRLVDVSQPVVVPYGGSSDILAVEVKIRALVHQFRT